MTEPKRLYRLRQERMLAGVAGGLAVYFDMDPTLMRVIWVLAAVFTGFVPVLIAYVVLAVVVPEEPLAAPPAYQAPPPPPPAEQPPGGQ